MEAQIERKQAAEELLRRRAIRSTLIDWACYYGQDKGWVPAQHHRLLLDKLQQVTDGTIKHSTTGDPCRNLMFLLPPGSAKSTYASVVFPAYAMGKKPGTRVILTSYASAIAWKQSRRTRQIVKSSKYQPIFSTALMHGNQSVEEWARTVGVTIETTTFTQNCWLVRT